MEWKWGRVYVDINQYAHFEIKGVSKFLECTVDGTTMILYYGINIILFALFFTYLNTLKNI